MAPTAAARPMAAWLGLILLLRAREARASCQEQEVLGNVSYCGFVTGYVGGDQMRGNCFNGVLSGADIQTAPCCCSPCLLDTACPTLDPTAAPTLGPSAAPTQAPSTSPTQAPSTSPTQAPTSAPSPAPTAAPTLVPSAAPIQAPSTSPTQAPTSAPSPAPTAAPTMAPSTSPTAAPTTVAALHVATCFSDVDGSGSVLRQTIGKTAEMAARGSNSTQQAMENCGWGFNLETLVHYYCPLSPHPDPGYSAAQNPVEEDYSPGCGVVPSTGTPDPMVMVYQIGEGRGGVGYTLPSIGYCRFRIKFYESCQDADNGSAYCDPNPATLVLANQTVWTSNDSATCATVVAGAFQPGDVIELTERYILALFWLELVPDGSPQCEAIPTNVAASECCGECPIPTLTPTPAPTSGPSAPLTRAAPTPAPSTPPTFGLAPTSAPRPAPAPAPAWGPSASPTRAAPAPAPSASPTYGLAPALGPSAAPTLAPNTSVTPAAPTSASSPTLAPTADSVKAGTVSTSAASPSSSAGASLRVGLTVAAVVLLLLLGGVWWWWRRRRHRDQAAKLFGSPRATSAIVNPVFHQATEGIVLPRPLTLAPSKLGASPDHQTCHPAGSTPATAAAGLVHAAGPPLDGGGRADNDPRHRPENDQPQYQLFRDGAGAQQPLYQVFRDEAPQPRYEVFRDGAPKQPAYLIPIGLGSQQQQQQREPEYAAVDYGGVAAADPEKASACLVTPVSITANSYEVPTVPTALDAMSADYWRPSSAAPAYATPADGHDAALGVDTTSSRRITVYEYDSAAGIGATGATAVYATPTAMSPGAASGV